MTMSKPQKCTAYFDGVDYVPEEYEGWEVARVMTEIDPESDMALFSGPKHLDYWNFDGSTWEWRSLADRYAELARRVLDRGLDLEEAERRWPHSMLWEKVTDEINYGGGSEEGKTEEEIFRDLMEDYAKGYCTSSIYSFEGDEQFGDARDALDLPEWAETFEYDDGGPGSGFTAYCIAVRPPYTWDDLEAWLKERQAKAASRGDKKARR